jgi:hypothetical protein
LEPDRAPDSTRSVRPPRASWAERLRRWLVPLAGTAALAAVLLVAANQSRRPAASLNQVSGMEDGFKALTFRDNSAGINFVVFQETPQPFTAGAGVLPARTRNDGSSFLIESE